MDSIFEQFWSDFERVNPQSTRHGAVETHVGPFCGKRAKRSIFNEKTLPKRSLKTNKNDKHMFKKNKSLLQTIFFDFWWPCSSPDLGVGDLFQIKNYFCSCSFRNSNFALILQDFKRHFGYLGKDFKSIYD